MFRSTLTLSVIHQISLPSVSLLIFRESGSFQGDENLVLSVCGGMQFTERYVISLLLIAEPAQLTVLTEKCLHLPFEIR